MSRMSFMVPLSVAPNLALADAGGPGWDIMGPMALTFFAVLCIVCIPISLVLRGAIVKRLAFGLGAAIAGLVLGAIGLVVGGSLGDKGFAPLALALLPVVCIGIWGIIQGLKAVVL